MSNGKHGIAYRLLAVLLALVLVFGMVPNARRYANATIEDQVSDNLDTTDPSEDPTDPSEDPTDPSEDPTDPSEDPTDPSEDPTDPSEDPTDPSEDSTDPSEDPTDPSEEPAGPTIDDVAITATGWTYDGEAHPLVSVTNLGSCKPSYQLDNGESSTDVPKVADAGTYTVTVTITGEDGQTRTETVSVTVAKKDITDVTLIGKGVLRHIDGQEQRLVDLTGTVDSDTVTWSVNGEVVADPVATEVGRYNVRVAVDRGENYNAFEDTAEVEIVNSRLVLDGLTVNGINEDYIKDKAQDLIVQSTINHDYTLEYQKSSGNQMPGEVWEGIVPQEENAGTYYVWVRATRNGVAETALIAAVINPLPIEKPAQPETSVFEYDGTEKVFEIDSSDYYTVSGNKQTNASKEAYWANVSLNDKVNYRWSDNLSAEDFGYSFTIEQAEQTLACEDYPDGETADISYTGAVKIAAENKTEYVYDEETQKENVQEIKYSLGEGTTENIATIDEETGELTVSDVGTVVVVATLPETADGNYAETSITRTLQISMGAAPGHKLVAFANGSVSYTFGENNGVVSENTAGKFFENDTAAVTYRIDQTDIGLTINAETGKVEISDYNALAAKLPVTVTVTASKGETKTAAVEGEEQRVLYGADETSYTLTVSFLTTPENPITVDGTLGKYDSSWYASSINVIPAEGYTIAKDCVSFGEEVTFGEQGSPERKVYLRHAANGGITAPVVVEAKIDTEAPNAQNMSVDIPGLKLVEKLLGWLGFTNQNVTVTFTVNDETGAGESGLNHINWSYDKTEDATDSILASYTKELSVELKEGKYVATMDLPAVAAEQLRGHISFTATDKAGNTSAQVKYVADKETPIIVVVDTINPQMSANHTFADNAESNSVVDRNGQYFYNCDVAFTFTIKEANFFSDKVNISVSDNGKPVAVTPVWTTDANNAELHYGTFTLSAEGDYTVTMSYTDDSGNPMKDSEGKEVKEYVSSVITIDKTPPVVSFSFDQENQKAIIQVKEHNFFTNDINIQVNGDVKNNAENEVAITEGEKLADTWSKLLKNGDWHNTAADTWVCEIDGDNLPGGIYNLTIGYTDIVGWNDTEIPEEFITDITPPSKVKINIEEPSLIETAISGITFGFYQPQIKVTFSAYEEHSKSVTFNWTYSREETSSKKSVIEELNGSEEVTRNKDHIFTATITLPAEAEDLLRGCLNVVAKDGVGNESESEDSVSTKDRDGNEIAIGGIVVDGIAPKVSITYDAPSNTLENRRYYNTETVDVKLTVEEANFFEDIAVVVDHTGEKAAVTMDEWVHDGDVHTRNYTLRGDGHYFVKVTYADKSTNKATITENVDDEVNAEYEYTSNEIIIDTKKPEITVKVADSAEEVKNTIEGVEYFDSPRTATIQVTEHNIDKNNINNYVTVVCCDEVVKDIAWSSDGDVHTAKIDFEEDGHYILDVSCTDKAERSTTWGEYKFVVDKTDPEILEVSYSEPSGGWYTGILEAISFGFYNAPATVTVKATDATAGIHYIDYSYNLDADVSKKNLAGSGRITKFEPDEENPSVMVATFSIPAEIAGEISSDGWQFHGYVNVTVADRSERTDTDSREDEEHIVVDTIAPKLSIAYNKPSTEVVTEEKHTIYYNKENDTVNVTLTVEEANFFTEDVTISVQKNGEPFPVEVDWIIGVDEHIGKFTLKGDGHYFVNVTATDKSTNHDKKVSEYTSDEIIIDTIAPVVTVDYSGDEAEAANTVDGREYYTKDRKATITIVEHNFNSEDATVNHNAQAAEGTSLKGIIINAADVANNNIRNDSKELYSVSGWSEKENEKDTYVNILEFKGESNYTFDITYTDLAGNSAMDYTPDYFTVDKTEPTNLAVTYKDPVKNWYDTILENVLFGFYQGETVVTLTAVDNISGINSFKYSYMVAEGVSKVNAGKENQVIEEKEVTGWTSPDGTFTAQFTIPKETITDTTQFNGTITFTATNRSLQTSKEKNGKLLDNNGNEEANDRRIVVDKISPKSTVTYNVPVNNEGGIRYYNGPIHGSITVEEANFYPEDMNVSVNNGVAVKVNWPEKKDTDKNTGTFTLTGDGPYAVNIAYADRSGNAMANYASGQMVIDTIIEAPVITINGEDGNGKAYKDEVVPSVSFEDVNYDSYDIKLTRTRFGSKNVDVTDQFIGNAIRTNATGGSGTFDTFAEIPENDGIYTLTVTMQDKAGHRSESKIIFTVNRFGSVYEYSDYLSSLIPNGGRYVTMVDEDLVVTEYNADRLVEGSLVIEITRDGKPLDNVIYTATPDFNSTVPVGESGWYQYTYAISKENFTSDGIYKISVSSKDATGNNTENNSYEDMGIAFRVDSTPPEISSIAGLEKAIINATEQEVKYTVYDTMGIKNIKLYVNGVLDKEVTDFSGDPNNYSDKFVLTESNSAQTVRIVVEDMSGNITDTDADTFSSAYEFHSSVTVSTNVFVRWYANKPLFWGSIGGGVAVIGGIGALATAKRKKKEEE